MSMGLPCISTDCSPGGASLLIEDGINGLIAPLGNIEKLAEMMCWMAEHPKEADEMAQKAMDISKTFSDEKISDMWINYMESLLKV